MIWIHIVIMVCITAWTAYCVGYLDGKGRGYRDCLKEKGLITTPPTGQPPQRRRK